MVPSGNTASAAVTVPPSVGVKENQLKIYLERPIFKDLIFSVDVYRSVGYHLTKNNFTATRQEDTTNPVFAPFKDNFGFTVGFAYRIMTAKPKKEME